MTRIDAHHHFWRLSRGDYGWLAPDQVALYRDYLPADLAPHLAAAGISQTILVQAAPTADETDFLLTLAAETSFVAGVVGWVDLEAPDASRAVAAFAKRSGALGLRPMLQDLTDDAWLLRPQLRPAFAAMVDHGLTFDALVKPRHLPFVRRFLDDHPDLPVVIDHGAKPDIARGGNMAWMKDIQSIARDTRACCKMSGLVTEARAPATADDLRPYVEIMLTAFGASRLMWGSDWPVLNRVTGYGRWVETAEALLTDLDVAQKAQIMGSTARAFYGLAA